MGRMTKYTETGLQTKIIQKEEAVMTLIIDIFPSLLNGLQTTLQLFLITLVISLPLGILLAVARVYGPAVIGHLIRAYVYVMRGTPLLLQLMFVFFGLPLSGIVLGRFSAAIITFTLNYAAYFSELFRGGILSIPSGQFEAIHILNIGSSRGFRRIIFPQMMRTVLPSIGNEVISLVKDTSLIYILGIGELLRAGQIAANTYASLVPFLAVGLFYMAITALLTFILDKVEERLVLPQTKYRKQQPRQKKSPILREEV